MTPIPPGNDHDTRLVGEEYVDCLDWSTHSSADGLTGPETLARHAAE